MPPKQIKCKISELVPTPEEVAAARKILDGTDTKGKKSKMASMTHFLKTSPDPVTEASRGAQRENTWRLSSCTSSAPR